MVKIFPLREIDNIQFSILSPEDIIKQSVCEITTHKLSGRGSVYDERMGSMNQDEKCISCELFPKDCPGHSGHINLNVFILHPMYMRYITNFLKCICVKCFRLVLSYEHLSLEGILKYNGDLRFEKVVEKMEKVDECYYCQNPKPKITFQQKTGDILMKYKEINKNKKSGKVIMTDYEIKKIFDNFPDEDVTLLGFNPIFMHPKNLVISVLQVIPPRARPYVIVNGATCDDDLTSQLCEIVKANQNLMDPKTTESKKIKYIQSIKFRVKTMMNNSQGKARHSNGRPIKGIKERLSGKGGLIRSHLMGKRRNQSARSAISADPTIRTNEIVIPEKIAQNVTIPETVASFNINKLQDIVNNGKANYVIKKDGATINLKYALWKRGTQLLWGDKILRNDKTINPFSIKNFILLEGDKILRDDEIIKDIQLLKKKEFHLEVGDVVARHLSDGDMVLFNRQPTLHRGSMLAKKVIVRQGKTLRFNLASTKSFNADFDGDEMNIFLPQDLTARAELLFLFNTQHNIMTCQSTKNIICITQDSLLGCFLLTKDDVDIGRERFFDICMHGDKWEISYINSCLDHIKKVTIKEGYNFPLYCGKTLFSMMLPKTLNYVKKNDARKDQPVVKIIKGVLLEGAINKSNLGQAHNSLIHVIYKEYGSEESLDFINNCQFISNQYLLHRGFTVGIQDCAVDISKKIEKIIDNAFVEAKDTETSINHESIRELKICSILNDIRDKSMKMTKSEYKDDNAFVATVTSGSKGEFFNITQITGMLGQQMHMNKRIEKNINKGKRTLPHYPFENMTLEQEFESRGFIKNSFMHGLNPQEFIWHAMTGREGCSDTAMKTAKSGYTQRKMVKVLEDIQIKYDGTVRGNNDWVVDWAYGGDGFDRANCTINGNGIFFVDVEKVADRLNNEYEINMCLT